MARPPKDPATAASKAQRAPTLKARAKDMSELALATLEAILRGEGGDTAKIAAAREVLDRAYGKTGAGEKASADKTVTVVIRRLSARGEVIPFKRQSND